ncbi:MAG: serine/threonine protein kinase, partial [Ktedonobacteraceae bacterium]
MVDRLGQQFGDHRLVKLLGTGDLAEVYLAEHLYQESQAAIKILHTRLPDLRTIHRFRQEARAIVRLEHPNLMRTLDFGVEGSTPYLVMYYAANGTLCQRHPRGQRLPLATIISYVTQVAAALQYAHSKYFIHHNVKPANMFIGEQQEILLSDFGMAALLQVSNSRSIEQSAGTVSYMAPEQIRAHPQVASDQYALAAVVYEWLCGALPFQGTGPEIILKQLSIPPLPLSEWILVAPEIEEVILRALNREPEERFVNVQDFANALKQAAQGISFTSLFPTQTSITRIVSAQTVVTPAVPEHISGAPLIPTYISSAPLPVAAPDTDWAQVQERQSATADQVSSTWLGESITPAERLSPFSQSMPLPAFQVPAPYQPQPSVQAPHADMPPPLK